MLFNDKICIYIYTIIELYLAKDSTKSLKSFKSIHVGKDSLKGQNNQQKAIIPPKAWKSFKSILVDKDSLKGKNNQQKSIIPPKA